MNLFFNIDGLEDVNTTASYATGLECSKSITYIKR